MELLTSLKLILRLWNIRLYYPSWDPSLFLCRSEFLPVDLKNLDTISTLTGRLIFKVNSGFLGPQIQMTTMILRFLINNLGFMFMHLTLFTSNSLYPLLLYIEKQAIEMKSVADGFWTTVSSMFWLFFYLNIPATIFFLFTIMQLL